MGLEPRSLHHNLSQTNIASNKSIFGLSNTQMPKGFGQLWINHHTSIYGSPLEKRNPTYKTPGVFFLLAVPGKAFLGFLGHPSPRTKKWITSWAMTFHTPAMPLIKWVWRQESKGRKHWKGLHGGTGKSHVLTQKRIFDGKQLWL